MRRRRGASTRGALASTEDLVASTNLRRFVPGVEAVEGVEANPTTLWRTLGPHGVR